MPLSAPSASAQAAVHPMSSSLTVLVLALLLGIQPVTTDLYLPALPVIRDAFGASMAEVQLTLGALLLAFGISQLFWGPLSDRFGRRPILLLGLGAYTIAAVVNACADSMLMLIACRIVQGAAMGAAVMCARAIVRDLYAPEAGARAMSRGLTGLGLIACASPTLGGALTGHFGWRVAMLAPALFGAATLAMIALRFIETVPLRNPRALEPATLWRTWATIVRNPTFLAFSALSAASYAGLFTFLASSSFVFINVLGLTSTEYGLVMLSVSIVYVTGTFVCRRLLPRLGVRRAVLLAGGFTLTGGTLMGVLALAGIHNGWAITLPFYLFMLAHGVHQPCSQSGAVGPFPQAAGAASALNGFFMMVVAFFIGGWLGTHMDGSVLPLVNGVWLWSVVIAFSAWVLVGRHATDPQS